MIVDTSTGEVIDSKRLMSLRDLRRPKHQRPTAWVHESQLKGYRVARPARQPRAYARSRRPGREASLVVELAKAVVVIGLGFAGTALLFAAM